MGLDFVELIMGLEDEFDIRIPDSMASRWTTVAESVDGIVRLLSQKPAEIGVCPTARSFYRLRRELVLRFGADQSDVRLDSSIGALVPQRQRRKWSQIADIAGLRREPITL